MKKIEVKNVRMPKVKISQKYAQIICGVIILLAVGGYIYLGILYNDEQTKQDDLDPQITSAELEWNRLKLREPEHLDELLAERRNELEAEKTLFPVDLSSNNVMEILLQAAEESNVNILPLGGINPAQQVKVLENEYYKVSFRLTPTGTLRNVRDFIDKLEKGTIGGKELTTIVVKDVSLSGKGGSWRASLSGEVYSLPAPVESGTPASNG